MNQLLMIQYQVIRNDTTKQEIKGLENIYILGNISKEYCLSHNGIRNNIHLYYDYITFYIKAFFLFGRIKRKNKLN